MVGTRKFDEGKVLDAIMTTFWRNGWRSTSMDQLAEAAEVQKGSLQNAYGNKEALFLVALRRYAETAVRASASSPQDRPEDVASGYLMALLERMRDPKMPRGCLTTFGCMEFEGLPEAAAAAVRQQMSGVVARLTEALEACRQAGSLATEADPRGMATFLVSVARGMAVMDKIGTDMADIESTARIAIGAIGAQSRSTKVEMRVWWGRSQGHFSREEPAGTGQCTSTTRVVCSPSPSMVRRMVSPALRKRGGCRTNPTPRRRACCDDVPPA